MKSVQAGCCGGLLGFTGWGLGSRQAVSWLEERGVGSAGTSSTSCPKSALRTAAAPAAAADGKAGKPGKEGSELDSDLEGHSDEEAVPKRGGRHKLVRRLPASASVALTAGL